MTNFQTRSCAEHGIGLSFCKANGRILARISGPFGGNVLLRRQQYRMADDAVQYMPIVQNMLFGKLHNSRYNIERAMRDHALRVDVDLLDKASVFILDTMRMLSQVCDPESIRGAEGTAANQYFGVFDQMILGEKPLFSFSTRSRRPPLDAVNALLSFAYSILANDCASALEAHGLDSYAGFLHRDRPGRKSLALDLMEELRPAIADRFVLTLINNRQLKSNHFEHMDNGAVLLGDDGRKIFLKSWQERKRKEITHPYLDEKIAWGLVPYCQAQLLARCIRGDLDGYPPFLLK